MNPLQNLKLKHMKTYLCIVFLSLILGYPWDVSAQCNPTEYKLILKLAQEDLENRNYQRSIERFLDARDVCPQNKKEVDQWIAEAFRRITAERDLSDAQALAFQIAALPGELNTLALRVMEAKWKEYVDKGEPVPPSISRTLASAFYQQFKRGSEPGYLLTEARWPLYNTTWPYDSSRHPQITPDGQYLLTYSGKDNRVNVWTAQGNLFALLDQHTDTVRSARFSPNGKLILTHSDDKTAKVWSLDGLLLTDLVGHTGKINYSEFSPDGEQILTAADDSLAKLWDLSGKFLINMDRHVGPVQSAQFLANGKIVVTYSGPPGNRQPRTAQIWHLAPELMYPETEYGQQHIRQFFSPDGKYLIIAGQDSALKLWTLTGEFVADLNPSEDKITHILFSPDNQHILTYSFDTPAATVWNLDKKKGVSLDHQTQSILNARFTSDGQRILTRSYGSALKLWDVSGNQLADLNPDVESLKNAQFSADGQFILLNYSFGSARIINKQGAEMFALGNWDYDVAFSPTGKYVYDIKYLSPAWNLGGHLIADITDHSGKVWGAYFTKEGKHLYTGGGNNFAKLWDTQGNWIQDFPPFKDSVRYATYSPDGKYLLTYQKNSRDAYLWTQAGDQVATLTAHTDRLIDAIFSLDSQRILTSAADSTVKLWDLAGNLLVNLKHQRRFIKSFDVCPDGHTLLTYSFRHSRFWNLRGELLFELEDADYPLFSPNGQWIITVANHESLQLRNSRGEIQKEWTLPTDYVDGKRFSPDGNHILTYGTQKRTGDASHQIWTLDGKLVADLPHHSQQIIGIRFPPDSSLFLTYAHDGSAKLWNYEGKLLADLDQHADAISNAVFSPDGQYILTYSDDGTLKYWNLQGELLADFEQHMDGINVASFSPDGKYVLSGSDDKTAKLWPTPQTIYDWLQSPACPLPPLTEEERKQYGLATSNKQN